MLCTMAGPSMVCSLDSIRCFRIIEGWKEGKKQRRREGRRQGRRQVKKHVRGQGKKERRVLVVVRY